MIWVILFSGLLLGWIIKWIIDTYRYSRMVEQLQSRHSYAITDITNRYESTIEQIQLRYEGQLGDAQEHHHAELNAAETKYNTRLTEQAAAHRHELETNQNHFQDELQLLESQRSSELNAHDSIYAQAKEALTQGYREELAQIKLEHEQSLRETAASLRTQYEEEHEQQRIFWQEAHQKDLSTLETRIRSEDENELSNVQQSSTATTQQQISEQESRLKRDYDYTLAQRDALHRNELSALKADYKQRIDELTLLSRFQTNTRPEKTNSITSSSRAPSSFSYDHAISHVQADDLTIIEGIGPKANNLLHDAGINSYSDLAHTGVRALQNILDNAGSRFHLLTPDTWPQQASLAAAGDWDALNQLKGALDGGKPLTN